MKIRCFTSSDFRSGFTLVEVVTTIAILGLAFGGIVTAYVQSARRAEWSGYSLAAQSLALQQLEQARSAKWDVTDTPVVDEITDLPTKTVTALDLPTSGHNVVRATNYITVETISIATNPVVAVHLVQVETVWPFIEGGRTVLYTNTVANYFAPDR